ncbi:MAG: tetratricopeptide repeat protein [Nitrospirota bacterium]
MNPRNYLYIELTVLIIVVVIFSLATYQRNFVWKGDLSLWSDVVKKSPKKFRPHNNLGKAYTKTRQYDLAIAEFKETLRLNPQADKAHNNLGSVYMDKRTY